MRSACAVGDEALPVQEICQELYSKPWCEELDSTVSPRSGLRLWKTATAAAAFSTSKDYKVISDDEEKFMDRDKIVAFIVDERVTERKKRR